MSTPPDWYVCLKIHFCSFQCVMSRNHFRKQACKKKSCFFLQLINVKKIFFNVNIIKIWSGNGFLHRHTNLEGYLIHYMLQSPQNILVATLRSSIQIPNFTVERIISNPNQFYSTQTQWVFVGRLLFSFYHNSKHKNTPPLKLKS